MSPEESLAVLEQQWREPPLVVISVQPQELQDDYWRAWELDFTVKLTPAQLKERGFAEPE